MTRRRLAMAAKVAGLLAVATSILLAIIPTSVNGGTCGELIHPRTIGGSQCGDIHLLMGFAAGFLGLFGVLAVAAGWVLSRKPK
jgi:hypothetical protein